MAYLLRIVAYMAYLLRVVAYMAEASNTNYLQRVAHPSYAYILTPSYYAGLAVDNTSVHLG